MGLFDIFKKKDRAKESKYDIGMKKTRDSVIKDLDDLLSDYTEVNDEVFDGIEEIFVRADMGLDTVVEFVEELRNDYRIKSLESTKDLYAIIIDKMFELYLKGDVVNANLTVNEDGVSVYLFVGVNGAGKTTSIGKLAYKLRNEGKKVLVAAGDTFRAGAVDQLKVWAERSGVDFFSKEEGADPSSVMYEALELAKNKGYDVLICDTAGRLQNKENLMRELDKINRVIGKLLPGAPHETLLVIDATTGQNGLSQALHFKETTGLSGIVLTKLDGSAKGGIVLAIKNQMNIAIKLVGLGEKIDDLEVFDIEEYIYGLFSNLF